MLFTGIQHKSYSKRRVANWVTVMCLVLTLGGCRPEKVEPATNPDLLLGSWIGDATCRKSYYGRCEFFCPQFTLTSSEFTLYSPGSLQTYGYHIEGNKLITTPGTGSIITFEYSPPFEFLGVPISATLEIKSEPANCNIDGIYSKGNHWMPDFVELTPWHATNLESEATAEVYLANTLKVVLYMINQFPNGQLEGPDPIEPLVWADDCMSASLERTGTTENPGGMITINFLNQYCSGRILGHLMIGTLVVTYAGKKFEPGSTISITHQDLFLHSAANVKVEGTLNLTYVETAEENVVRVNVSSQNAKFSFDRDSSSFHWNRNLEFEWRKQPPPSFDQWAILSGGSGSGIDRDGQTYTISIQKEILFKMACIETGLPVAGEVLFQAGNRSFTFNYPETDADPCNLLAWITINGATGQWYVRGNGIYSQ